MNTRESAPARTDAQANGVGGDDPVAPSGIGLQDFAMPPPRHAEGRSGRAALAISLTIHAALGAFVLWRVAQPGATDATVVAISVELAPTEVVDALENADKREAAASPSVAASGGEETPSPQPPERAEAPPPENGAPTVETTAAPDPAQPSANIENEDLPQAQPQVDATERGRQPDLTESTPIKTSVEPRRPAPKRERPPQKLKAADEKPAAPAKSASSRGAPGASSASAQMSARTGSASNYSSIVQARVAANRPGSSAEKGNVRVVFGVSASGGLAFVRISQSSGKSVLDQAVISAVRRAAPFPPPPTGAPRSFYMPFTFR